MHDSDGIIMSVAPPQSDTIGVGSENRACLFAWYISSMRASKRAGGSVCGADIVRMAEIRFEGSRDVATIPPIECPMTIIEVLGG